MPHQDKVNIPTDICPVCGAAWVLAGGELAYLRNHDSTMHADKFMTMDSDNPPIIFMNYNEFHVEGGAPKIAGLDHCMTCENQSDPFYLYVDDHMNTIYCLPCLVEGCKISGDDLFRLSPNLKVLWTCHPAHLYLSDAGLRQEVRHT